MLTVRQIMHRAFILFNINTTVTTEPETFTAFQRPSAIGVQSRNQWPKWAEMKIIYQHCFNIYWHPSPRHRSALSAARLQIKMSTKHRQGHAKVLFQRAVRFVWGATIIWRRCTGRLQDSFKVCEVCMRQIKLSNHSHLSNWPDLINHYLHQRLKFDLNQMRKRENSGCLSCEVPRLEGSSVPWQ